MVFSDTLTFLRAFILTKVIRGETLGWLFWRAFSGMSMHSVKHLLSFKGLWSLLQHRVMPKTAWSTNNYNNVHVGGRQNKFINIHSWESRRFFVEYTSRQCEPLSFGEEKLVSSKLRFIVVLDPITCPGLGFNLLC